MPSAPRSIGAFASQGSLEAIRTIGTHGVPEVATIIACAFSSDQLKEWVAQGQPFVAELAKIREVEYVDLPTGHWPQFTKPKELAQAILESVDRT